MQCQAGSTPVRDVEVYDPDHPSNGWVVESYIPEEKFRFASATYDGSIFGMSSFVVCLSRSTF